MTCWAELAPGPEHTWSLPCPATASLTIAPSPAPRDPHREQQLHVLAVRLQTKDSDAAQMSSVRLLEDGSGTQVARVKGQVKGHITLEVT